MRKLFFAALLLSTLLIACDSDDDQTIKSVPPPDPVGLMSDGGGITSMKMNCITFDIPQDDEAIKTLEGYADLLLHITISHASVNAYQPGFTEKDIQEMRDKNEMEEKFYREKTQFIQQEYNDSIARHGWPSYFTAYVNGEVSITCDKPLFGLAAGENLGRHFKVNVATDCIPVGIEHPYLLYHFGDELPLTVADFFPLESWILYEYWLKPLSLPEEQYDSLTFRFTLPMTVEHTGRYIKSLYEGTNEELKRENKVFEAECVVKFKWE